MQEREAFQHQDFAPCWQQTHAALGAMIYVVPTTNMPPKQEFDMQPEEQLYAKRCQLLSATTAVVSTVHISTAGCADALCKKAASAAITNAMTCVQDLIRSS
jgi:hypothetical protein